MHVSPHQYKSFILGPKLIRMKILLFLFVFVSIQIHAAKKSTKPILKEGEWSGKLVIDKQHSIPFKLVTSFRNEKEHVYIYNGSEEIELEISRKSTDTVRISFIQFHSELLLTKHSKHKWLGYWHNYNKKNYAIACELSYGYTNRFHPRNTKNKPIPIHGKWECTFEPGTIDSYKAVGLFDQKNTELSGTFLTETGDYRFLEGNVYGDSIFLSCFDGSHAYLFQAKLKGDTLKGLFYSGKHWRTNWLAIRNETFELSDPESLTKVVQPNLFFSLPDLSGANFSFPNETYKEKVVLIQIMGTWCPNCMDETKYFKTLFETYHHKGLEIISIGYETGDTFEEYSAKIKRLQQKLNLPFTFLVGGAANKNLAAQHFSMLDHIISFPTTIYVDKKGQIRKVYTGFNGPGTGKYFTDYTKETEEFLEQLLSE